MAEARCPNCGHHANFRHLHDSPYGMEGAHIDGSERFECALCRHLIFAHDTPVAGLNFVLDKPRTRACSEEGDTNG